MLGKILSATQNAFVEGRQILDAVLIASECIDHKLTLGIPGMLCKLDIEKAYDHVKWGFLMHMLKEWVLRRSGGVGFFIVYLLQCFLF